MVVKRDTLEDQDVPFRYLNNEEADRQTTWFNPSQEHTVKMELLTTNKTGKKGTGISFRRVVIPPQGKITLSGEYDQAIRKTNKVGQVVGGQCPWLLKDGEQEILLHPALEAHKEIEKQELYKLAEKIKEERDLEEARAVKQEMRAKAGRPKKAE